MFERFTKDARAVVVQAVEVEAARAGARTIEAEHLLLALAARGVAGLDHDTISEALEDEQRRSLAAVGVELDAYDLPAPVRPHGKPRFGTSAKGALERALTAAVARRDRRIVEGHLLLGVLAAERGTVPRALRTAGIDADAVRRRAFSTP